MARPMMIASLVFIATLAVSVFLPISVLPAVAVFISAAALLLFLISKSNHKLRNIAKVSIFSVLSIACFLIYNYVTVIPAANLKGTTADISATVLETELSKSGDKFYIVRLNTIDGKAAPRDLKIRLFCSESDDLNDYDKIAAGVNFFQDSAISSSDRYYLSNSILASATTLSDITVTNADEFSPLREICLIRDKMVFNIRSGLPTEEGNILCGILFGKRDYINSETTDLFAASGISHLLAISGLHLSIIVFLINALLGIFRIGKVFRSVITLVFTAVLMIMTGFTPSILRAGIMITCLLFAQFLRYDYDAPTALSFSAVIICIINPYAITNIGFLLSFSATLGLIVSQTLLDKVRATFSLKTVGIVRLVLYEILKLIVPCFFAFMFTVPVSACVFGYLSVYSPITNLIISPLLPLTLAVSLAAAIFSLTPFAFIYQPIFFIAKHLISCIIQISEFFSSLPFSKIYLSSDITLPIVIILVILFLFSAISSKPLRNSAKAALLCVPIICAAVLTNAALYAESTTVTILGSSVLIESGGKRFVSGFGSDTAYELDNIIDKSPDKDIFFLSAASVTSSEVSDLTHFALNNDIKLMTVPEKYAATFSTIHSDSFSTDCYISDKFSVSSDDISVRSYVSEGGSAVIFNITGFVIAHLEIESANSLPEEIDCDLLIANSKALAFIEHYRSDYFLLSDSSKNPKELKELLSRYGTVYVGDNSSSALVLKDNKLYKNTIF